MYWSTLYKYRIYISPPLSSSCLASLTSSCLTSCVWLLSAEVWVSWLLHAAAADCTRILLGGPNMGRPRSRNLVRLAPIFFHSWTNQRGARGHVTSLHQSQLTWTRGCLWWWRHSSPWTWCSSQCPSPPWPIIYLFFIPGTEVCVVLFDF